MANYTVLLRAQKNVSTIGEQGIFHDIPLPDWDGTNFQIVADNVASEIDDSGKPKYLDPIYIDIHFQSAYYSDIRIITIVVEDQGSTVSYVNRARYVTDTAGATDVHYSDIKAEIKAIGEQFMQADWSNCKVPYAQASNVPVAPYPEEDWATEINTNDQPNPTNPSPTFEDYKTENNTVVPNPWNSNNDMTDSGTTTP